jgi:MFS family permease
MSLTTIASVIGVFLGGFIATISITVVLWINVVPKLISLVLVFFLKDIKREEQVNTNIYSHLLDAFKEIKQNLTLKYLSLSTIFGGAGFAAGELQAAAFAVVWPTWAVGFAKGIQSVAGIPGYYYAGKLIDKFGAVKIMAAGLITSVLGNVLTGSIRTVISPLFVMFSLPLYGPADTAEQKILQAEFTEKQRATIASLNSFGNSVVASIVLYACGIIANSYGPFTALLATQVFLIPSMYFQFLFFRRVRNIH